MSGIGEGKACFMVMDDSLKTWDGEFWEYLRQEGFQSWGMHGNWGCSWVYVNVNSKIYTPGMPGSMITKCVMCEHPLEALSIDEFKTIWEILKNCKERGKYLLLTATEYRTWFDVCEEWEWEKTSWRIYSEGTYRITVTLRPGRAIIPEGENKGGRKSSDRSPVGFHLNALTCFATS